VADLLRIPRTKLHHNPPSLIEEMAKHIGLFFFCGTVAWVVYIFCERLN